ncbi:restriction endonuclease subunit S [Verminephrobacter aporrectodeae subsp. tuberculatae]|uniref:Restriction endonuclease subunit S n=1 Tax=Verminephrobacter aporrectodeae subsp. tuberculatae TaxID=1110392 RepID=A0ABT3KTE9_9BURK|nr:hypothetical protein [Verminephrobacter aporrectodeae]MCW5321598.1 restriction endonuclease subunit S [Verminephrobacter aporrectodeae subsp. tuberculatae]
MNSIEQQCFTDLEKKRWIQTKILVALHDTFLPKLLSGELSVDANHPEDDA